MKMGITLLCCDLTTIVLCFATALAVDVAAAQCPNRGTVVVEGVSNSKGKPYEAKEIRKIVTYRDDGLKNVVVTKENLFRDSRGRIRIERFYDGTENPPENVPVDILIDDNCGTSVILRPGLQTASITKMASPSRVSDHPLCEEADLRNPPYTGPEGKFEDLGHKLIDGVEVRGERMSYYTSVEAKLSGAPPVRVYENWCSILLDTPRGNYVLDEKPKREITMVVTNMKQIEPESTRFDIPSEYKVIPASLIARAPDSRESQHPPTPD